MKQYLEMLNKEQFEAATETEGAVLVLAGAGSGKTRVLTSRIAYILDKELCTPSQILAITFTNKAANEMRERVESFIGEDVNGMWISTIHSMCLRILRNSIGRLSGYNKNFTVYSETESERVIKKIISEMQMSGEGVFKNAKYHISYAKTNDISPDRYVVEGSGFNLSDYAKIYKRYEQILRESNAMDFDDLLLKTYHLLEDDEEVCSYYAEKFHYIHIDEFQDTNLIQYNIVKLLSSKHGNVFAVGDDDQSIYGWRGAEIKNILGFNKDFKDSKVFKLQQNYRSTKKILELANTIIKNNKERTSKTLWTENEDGVKVEYFSGDEESDEARYAVKQIKSLVDRGASYSDFAILMRVNATSRSYEQEFLKNHIPFKVFGGFKFFERKEIKDLTAYLRIIANPLDNDAILRVINTPKRGIGDKTVNELINYASLHKISLFDALCENDNLNLSASAKMRLELFKQTLFKITLSSTNMQLSQLVEQVIIETDFLSQFADQTDENLSKKMNVDEFKNSVCEFCKYNKSASLEDYLGSIALYSDVDEADSTSYVTLATIHSVKGLEFKTVFVIGCDENIFPISRAVGSPADMEEERRLMYVAITRARDRLYFTRANSRYLYGERQFTVRSRFITEIADKLGIDKHDRKPLVERSEDYINNSNYIGYKKAYDNYKSSDEYNFGYSQDEPSSSGMSNYAKTFARTLSSNQKQSAKNISGFVAGRQIKHKRFGVGTIITVKNNSGNVIIDVAFKGVGVKSLSASLAPIELI